MINLNDPLAVLAGRLPWDQIETAVAAKFERQERAGQVLEGHDMFGPTLAVAGGGISNAGRPKLPIGVVDVGTSGFDLRIDLLIPVQPTNRQVFAGAIVSLDWFP